MLSAVMDKIGYTWSLMGASWEVLKQETMLLLYPLLSGICCLIVAASFAIPIYSTGAYEPPGEGAAPADQVIYYGTIFLFYFANYFVITFFNTAIVASAVMRLGGGDPTFAWGLGEAGKRVHLILGWALVAATVGMLLRVVQQRSGKVGQVAAAIGGVAWTLMTFLVVPVLVVQNKGPLSALKESSRLLRGTWGEQLVGNFSFGLIFFLINIPAFAALIGGIVLVVTGRALAGYSLIGVGLIYLLIAGLVQSALQGIFQAAVYLYASSATQPAPAPGPRGFPVTLLRDAVGQK